MKVIQLVQQSDEWHKFRANGIGASDIASISGIKGAFKTRNEVIQEKLGNEKKISDFQAHMFAEGNAWEIDVRDKINEGSSFTFVPAVVVADHNDRFFASLDGIDIERETILEIKHVRTRERFEQYCKEVPEHYNSQVQWQMDVTGFKNAMIAFVHNGEVGVKIVEPNEVAQEYYRSNARDVLAELDEIRAGLSKSSIQTIEMSKVENLIFLKRNLKVVQVFSEELEQKIKAVSESLLLEHKADKLENEAISIQWVERQGNVDYKKVPELKGIDLNKYRGKGSKYVQTKLKGTTDNE